MAQNKQRMSAWLAGWLVVFFLAPAARAQSVGQYLLLFRDKAGTSFRTDQPTQFLSARSVGRRQRQGIAVTGRDLPVSATYLQGVRRAGATVLYTSRWLNAALIEATAAQLSTLLALSYVQGIETGRVLNNARLSQATEAGQRARKFGQAAAVPAYGAGAFQLQQLGVDTMHARGYRGEGMLVAVLDAGFQRANQVPFLATLFSENRLLGTYDFPDRETNVYNDDDHGLNVLSLMAAELPNQLYGPAYKASYLLLRTEIAVTENPVEEAYWLLGAEYADSTGADIINSSLGYSEFDNPADSHTYADLTGSKTLISRAATWAAEAGMLVVNSAGNEGSNAWRYITPPADSPVVLSIGAVDQTGALARFSSIGPTPDGRLKPDLVALGQGTVIGSANGSISIGSGTSFSSPLVAALAAGFWQAHPTLTAAQVRNLLRQSGSQVTRPDNLYGYGIPNFDRASVLAQLQQQVVIFPNPFTDTDRLTVTLATNEIGQPVTMQLTDLAGRVVFWQNYPAGETAFLIAQPVYLQAGIYLATVSTPNHTRTVRLLKR